MKTLAKILVITLFICLLSCESDYSYVTMVNLEIKATNTSIDLNASKKSTTYENLEINSAIIGLERIELKLLEENENSDDNEYLFEGPYVIDLLTKTNEPRLPLSEISPGTYTKFEAELYVRENLGYSIFISGTLLNETDRQKIIYTYAQTEDFKAENANGFEITEGMINDILVLIDMNTIFTGVDFSQASISEDNIIWINKESNNDLADLIEANIEMASEIVLD